jgi:cellulose synthase/poly-beta-1,6-N-acetylglucosamine synthase-like glycosyltransferase
MLQSVFYISLFLIFYAYVGYPLIVGLYVAIRRKSVGKKQYTPPVSIVIAAYNEARSIADTIRNKLELDYPPEHLEIIVVSDGSTDGTDRIVKGFSGDKVKLLRQEPRAGKTSALNMAIPQARGEIIVFSDANSIYDSEALKALTANFADPEVGYVTGKMIYVNPDGTMIGDGCSAYMKYENFLRGAETALGSIVGVDGGIDAIRKSLYRPMNADQLPDFVQPLKVVEQGFRVVYEPGALLKEPALTNASDEYRMRVRVTLRAFWALRDMRRLLVPGRNSLFSWQLWSHKVLRYLCFIPLLLLFVCNFALIGESPCFFWFFLLQSACYVVALAASSLNDRGVDLKIVTFIRYFALLNLACAHAFLKFLSGRKMVVWTPRKG